MQASGLEADQALSVMALGGFLGSDPATTPGRFAAQVDAGQVRFVLAGGPASRAVALPGGGGAFPGGGGRVGGGVPGAGGGVPAQWGPRAAGSPAAGSLAGAALPAAGSEADRAAPVEGNAAEVIALAEQVCTPVSSTTSAGFPSTYDGQVYDCAGQGARPWRSPPADGRAGRRACALAASPCLKSVAGRCVRASCVRGDRVTDRSDSCLGDASGVFDTLPEGPGAGNRRDRRGWARAARAGALVRM